MGGNNEFFENFERNNYLKKLPSMQRVKLMSGQVGFRQVSAQVYLWYTFWLTHSIFFIHQ